MSNEALPTDSVSLNCEGYRKLLAAVERDEKKGNWHDYRGKLAWIVDRAKHYAEKTGLSAESILDAWEARRDYWYMNYYQPSQLPEIKDGKVRVFETVDEMLESIGDAGFRCPHCAGISKSPYKCTSATVKDGKVCDWKAYGLFGCLGKGVTVFVKDKMCVETFFAPIAWDHEENVKVGGGQ